MRRCQPITNKKSNAAAKKQGGGLAMTIWRRIAESKECAPDLMLEIYHYARDPANLDLIRSFASLAPADQLAAQHVIKRMLIAQQVPPIPKRKLDGSYSIN